MPLLRRRTTRWRIALLGVCGVILATSIFWWPAMSRHAQLLYWQRRCLTNVVPADSVVLKIDDVKDVLARSAPQWDSFYAAMSPPGKKTSPTVFVGSVPTSDGSGRILAIDLFEHAASPSPNLRSFLIRTSVVTPGLLTTPKVVEQSYAVQIDARSMEIHGGRVGNGGQRPHVTFDAVLDGKQYTYQVWLSDDHEVSVDRFDRVTPPAP